MKELAKKHGNDEERIVMAYAEAEARGGIQRESNEGNWTPEQYARALWKDGIRKGWLGIP